MVSFLDRLHLNLMNGFRWLNLLLVVLVFSIVLLRYVFGVGWIWLQEAVQYLHALIFMACVGSVLAKDSHVRVDIFYQKLNKRQKAWIDSIGTLLFLLPMALALLIYSFTYVTNSWSLQEGSREAGGIQAIFILKSFIWIYAVSLISQGFIQLLKNLRVLRGHYE